MKTAIAWITGMVALGIGQAGGDELSRAPLGKAIAEVQAHGFDYGTVEELAELLLQVQGRATIIDPDGQRRKYAFGADRKIKLKDGGAEIDLRFAPDQEAVEGFVRELGELYAEHGAYSGLIEKALAGFGEIDRFGELRIAGLVVDPDGNRHDFSLGNAANESRKKFAKRMERGGALLELRVAPGETAMALLQLAEGGLASPQSSVTEEGKPAAPQLLDQALANPETRSLLNQGMREPAVQGLIKKGLDDPETMKLAEQALRSDTAQAFLGQMLGAMDSPSKRSKPADSPAPELGQAPTEHPRDAEIRELKNELREQRLMLEKILEKVGAE